MRFVCLALLLAACGGDVAIEGLYQTTYQTSNDSACTEGPVMIQKPYFQVARGNLLGQTIYTIKLCDTADTTQCNDPLSGAIMTQSVDNGWTGSIGIAVYTGSACNLAYWTSSAILSGSKLRAQVMGYQGDVMLSEAQCASSQAQQRGTSLPCKSFDVVEGTRVR
jgi:hypothetical protein